MIVLCHTQSRGRRKGERVHTFVDDCGIITGSYYTINDKRESRWVSDVVSSSLSCVFVVSLSAFPSSADPADDVTRFTVILIITLILILSPCPGMNFLPAGILVSILTTTTSILNCLVCTVCGDFSQNP